MLKRRKYSRLHSDPLTAFGDFPRRLLPVPRPSFLKNLFIGGTNSARQMLTSVPDMKGQTCHTPIQQQTDASSVKIEHRLTMKSNCTRDTICRSSAASHEEDEVFHHHVKYMGSVEVRQAMSTLDCSARTQVTREAISRLCQGSSAKTTKQSEGNARNWILGEERFSGRSAILTVSSEGMTLMSASSLQKLVHHSMHAISFASGAGPGLSDYIAYVAKDALNFRACHVLECPPGRSSEVIHSISGAFATRLQQVLSPKPPSQPARRRMCDLLSLKESVWSGNKRKTCHTHPKYCNAIPGKNGLWNAAKGSEKDAKLVSLQRPALFYENCSISDATSRADTHGSVVRAQDLPAETRRQTELKDEAWFHGRLGRPKAERLLSCRGDFLVRESASSSGQYVLSGHDGGSVQHLLLVDPNGQIRTQDRVFLSISHLLRFHVTTRTPIVAGGSELYLKTPVLQRTKPFC